MAIRFACPACRQPLEVDDEWGGQSVACPYCQRVVTAPQTSTWPTGTVPVANPAGGYGQVRQGESGFAPPPPPVGYAPGPMPAASNSALGALVLTLVGAGLSLAATFGFSVTVSSQIMDRVGPRAGFSEAMRVQQELLEQGRLRPSGGLSFLMLLAAISSIAGLVMAVRSLARREGGRGMAITACVLGPLFLLCPIWWLLMLINIAALAG